MYVREYNCLRVGGCVCVCLNEEETLLHRVQIYLYANWILVKRLGMPHGLSPLDEMGLVINYPNKSRICQFWKHFSFGV